MISFRELKCDDAQLILNWRTKERITNFMNTDITHGIDVQKKWIADSFKKRNYYHWIIQCFGQDVGFINFVDWDVEEKSTSWGFYIGEERALGIGIGGRLLPCFYKFAFDVLRVECINAEVFHENTKAIRLYAKQGFKFYPSRDYVIKKRGSDILVVCMSLSRETFKRREQRELNVELPIKKWEAAREIHLCE